MNPQIRSWGFWMLLDENLPGTADIVILRDFLIDTVPFQFMFLTREREVG
jgi:hypothetical protein